MQLSDKLKKYRKRSGLTQSALGHRLHVSRKTISNWENGRSEPDFDTLSCLCGIYKISLNQLRSRPVKPHPVSRIFLTVYYLNVLLFFIEYLNIFEWREFHAIIMERCFLLDVIILLILTIRYYNKNHRYLINFNRHFHNVTFISLIYLVVNIITFFSVHWFISIPHGIDPEPYRLGYFIALATKLVMMIVSFFLFLISFERIDKK